MNQEITFTKRLAPEDILPGSFVAITAMTHEIFPFWLVEPAIGKTPDMIRVPCIGCADGDPKRVLAVCLPFVLTRMPGVAPRRWTPASTRSFSWTRRTRWSCSRARSRDARAPIEEAGGGRGGNPRARLYP